MMILRQSDGVIEIRFSEAEHAFTRLELLNELGCQCEHEEIDGAAFADALIEVMESDEAPDGLNSQGEPVYSPYRADTTNVTSERCTQSAEYIVTICDCPETIDEPDVYRYCRDHAKSSMGNEFISALM